MQIHNLPAQTTAANADVLAIDNGTTTQKITVANLGKKVTEDATPAFTSNDSTTANAWTNVAVLASAETMKSILNKISTMFKNIRYLYNAVTQLNTDLTIFNISHTVDYSIAKSDGAIYKNGMYVYGDYYSEPGTYASDQKIFTLPEGAKPGRNVTVPAYIAGVIATVRIKTNGEAVVWAYSGTAAGRICFSFFFHI